MSFISRRSATAGLAASLAGGLLVGASPVFAQRAITRNDIENDPGAPIGGNPKGDVTIVAFVDYNCPFCKKSAPDLDRIVKVDGRIRLVYKDWPILGEASVYGAQLAVAAKYQDKYEVAHMALMNIPGKGVTRERMAEAIRASGIDVEQMNRDLQTHASDIGDLLTRNLAQADALGLQGTPTYLIGRYKTSTLDYEGFKRVVTDARKNK